MSRLYTYAALVFALAMVAAPFLVHFGDLWRYLDPPGEVQQHEVNEGEEAAGEDRFI